MPDVPPLLTIAVRGTPGTAGSKSAFPLWRTDPVTGKKEFVRTVQVEQDKHKVKANWRTAVMAAAADLIDDPDRPGRIVPPYPLDEALRMEVVFTLAKPAAAPKTRRTWPATGVDVDKATRALLDALQAAGVLKNDARVCEFSRLAKVYPGEDPDALDVPGAVIRIWRMADLNNTRPVLSTADLDLLLPLED